MFSQCIPKWITQLPRVETDWSACLQTLEGHKGQVTTVIFSPDGRTLASASHDLTIRVWDTATGEEKQILTGHAGPITGITFTNDGKRLVSVARDKAFRVWDPITGEEYQKITHKLTARDAAFSPNTDMVALESLESRTDCWTFPECENISARYGENIKRIVFSPDGETVATLRGGVPGAAIHDRRMGDIVRHINGTTGWVRAITYFPNSKLCATANSVNGIQVWDIATGEVKQELGGPALSVRRLMVSPDSKVIALVTKDKLVRIWNLVTGQEMKIFSGKKRWTGSLDSIVTLMTFSNTSETVIASDGNSVLNYDLAEDQMRYLHDFIYPDFIINKDKVYVFRNFVTAAISMSPDEKLIALLSSDSTIWIYHVVTGRGQKLSPRTGAARTSLRFTSDGQFLETNRGMISLQPDTDASDNLQSDSVWGQRSAFLGEEWLVRDGRKLLWFPPDYRSSSVEYHDGTFVLAYAFGQVKFIKIQFS